METFAIALQTKIQKVSTISYPSHKLCNQEICNFNSGLRDYSDEQQISKYYTVWTQERQVRVQHTN